MSYAYIKFNSSSDRDTFFKRLNECIYEPIAPWYEEDGLVLYGYINNESNDFPSNAMLCFGKTVTPDEITPIPEGTIFSKLKVYGSSKKYKGLLDIRGKVILDNIHDDIMPFIGYDSSSLLITKKNNLYGLVKCDFFGKKADIILPCKYDKIFNAQEYTIGFVENGFVGFMDMDGRVIVAPQFLEKDGYNIFAEGKAEVLSNETDAIPYYINHYGNYIEMVPFEISSTFESGTNSYDYGDLPDSSDAYEGDDSNRWNTD